MQENFLADEEFPAGDMNKKIYVKKARCPQNHSCPAVRVCPVGALTQHGHFAPVADLDVCIRCGKCIWSCARGALVLE